jgi:hypothetical protein
MKRNYVNKGHLLPGAHIVRDKSEHNKEASQKHPLPREPRGRDKSEHRKKASEPGALTV